MEKYNQVIFGALFLSLLFIIAVAIFIWNFKRYGLEERTKNKKLIEERKIEEELAKKLKLERAKDQLAERSKKAEELKNDSIREKHLKTISEDRLRNEKVKMDFRNKVYETGGELLESEFQVFENVKYMNYFDDNEYVSWDYFSFSYKDYFWFFNLTGGVRYSIQTEPKAPYNDYMLRRSGFGLNSISQDNFVKSLYILKTICNNPDSYLNAAKRNNMKSSIESSIFTTKDFELFYSEFIRKMKK